MAFRFKIVAGTIDREERNKILSRYNISGKEATQLEDIISNQHKKAAYKDYAHEAVQLSIFTNPSIIYSVGG